MALDTATTRDTGEYPSLLDDHCIGRRCAVVEVKHMDVDDFI